MGRNDYRFTADGKLVQGELEPDAATVEWATGLLRPLERELQQARSVLGQASVAAIELRLANARQIIRTCGRLVTAGADRKLVESLVETAITQSGNDAVLAQIQQMATMMGVAE